MKNMCPVLMLVCMMLYDLINGIIVVIIIIQVWQDDSVGKGTCTTSDDLSSTPRNSKWKEGTNFQKLSPDFHTGVKACMLP